MIQEIISPLMSLCDSLKIENKPIFLYGMGDGAEKIHDYLQSNGIKITGIVASDGFVRGQEFLEHTVISVSEACKRHGALCLVLCFGLEGEKSHFLRELAKEHRIVSPNLPVFGNGACDKSFILENAEKFERIYEMLADYESKEIYLNLLKYNVTGDISYLDYGNGISAPEEFFNHSLRHIDVGAYDGDTVLDFVSRSDTYTDIIAFEPDPATFRRFCANTAHLRDCIGINAAAGRKNQKVGFVSGGGRASHADIGGDSLADCVSIDEYCGFRHIAADGNIVGSIKIDAEGMDEDVICGAVNTIYCCKPNICAALYHRAADIIELPLLLRKHNSNYKFYIRKKEYVPAWDVFLYAIAK